MKGPTAFHEARTSDGIHKLKLWPTFALSRFGGHFSPGIRAKNGAGNGIRTRDFDLGKVALYH